MITGLVADINKRLTANKTTDALTDVQRNAQAADLEKLKLLLDAMQNAPPAEPAKTQSLSIGPLRTAYAFSSRAVLAFELGEPLEWNGKKKPLFVRTQDIAIRVRLKVAEPVPKTPLAKALLKIILRDAANPAVQVEKTFKLKAVAANSVQECVFQPGEIAQLPSNKPLAVLAEMRWLAGKTPKEIRALGSAEIVLVNKYFLKDRGQAVGAEVELTDMQRYRQFWNKLWESPVLDAGGGEAVAGKRLWEIDVNAKYSVVLSAAHETNGIMEAKIKQAPPDPDSVSHRTDGRMKAGIELSVAELNKLLPLFDGAPPLDAERLDAFSGLEFLNDHGGEFLYHFKMKGKRGERGLIWVIPVFRLFVHKLAVAMKVDGAGQVVGLGEEEARFPAPVAARLLGLRSAR
jgi:hypothetical protein